MPTRVSVPNRPRSTERDGLVPSAPDTISTLIPVESADSFGDGHCSHPSGYLRIDGTRLCLSISRCIDAASLPGSRGTLRAATESQSSAHSPGCLVRPFRDCPGSSGTGYSVTRVTRRSADGATSMRLRHAPQATAPVPTPIPFSSFILHPFPPPLPFSTSASRDRHRASSPHPRASSWRQGVPAPVFPKRRRMRTSG